MLCFKGICLVCEVERIQAHIIPNTFSRKTMTGARQYLCVLSYWLLDHADAEEI